MRHLIPWVSLCSWAFSTHTLDLKARPSSGSCPTWLHVPTESRSAAMSPVRFPRIMGCPKAQCYGLSFYLYTQPPQESLDGRGIWYHKYANDSTLYAIYDPAVAGDLVAARGRLIACFKEVKAWLPTFYRMNDCKTEFLCILSHYHLTRYGREAIQLQVA